MASFFHVVTAAIADTIEFGYESEERLQYWIDAIREAAIEDLVSEDQLEDQLRRVLTSSYERLIERGGILKQHPTVERFSIQQLKPELRDVLDRYILNVADLIQLNRETAIADTIRRFRGWATSIPAGGTEAADRKEVKENVRKGLTSLPFEERRVLIDQGHKLNAALSEIIAHDQEAIAAQWVSNFLQANYKFRPDHKERDVRTHPGGNWIYAVKGNWAIVDGLMKVGPAGYLEDITRAGEEPFCRCYMIWIYNLGDLPPAMLTNKGKEALAGVRAAMAGD